MLKNRASSDKQMNAFRVGEGQTHFWLKIHFFQIVFKICSIAEKLMITFMGFRTKSYHDYFLDVIASLDLGYECKKERKKESK